MQAANPRYAHFVPARLARAQARQPGAVTPRAERVEGAVAFADIIGYTALTEAYADRGPEGVETLSNVLNAFFGRLEEIVEDCGGDIMSFAGDSVLALWTADQACDLAAATARAVAFAHRAQRTLDGKDPQAGASLRMRIAIVAGEFELATVGGAHGHWHHVVTGRPLAGIGPLLRRPASGAILVSADAWPLIGGDSEGVVLPAGVHVVPVSSDSAPLPRGGDRALESTQGLRGFIPVPVLEHLDAGQFEWLSEYRHATTLFAGLGEVDCRTGEGLARFHCATAGIQEAVERYEGTLTRVIVDDKGANVLAVWGVAGRQHEDDALRAASCGLAICSALRGLGVQGSVGVATGRVLCGLTGGGSRCEYSVSGRTVNIAARLMARANAGVVCDAATFEGARRQVVFEPLGPLNLKGREEPLEAWRACEAERTHDGGVLPRTGLAPLVGRESDRLRMMRKLAALRGGQGGVLVVSGEAGIGKSRLLLELTHAAPSFDVACLTARGDDIEKNTTYFPWRALLRQVLQTEAPHDPASIRRYLEETLAPEPHMRAWLPLLNGILPLGVPETTLTSQMSEQSRAEGTSEIMVRVLKASAGRRPMLIVIDDVQWMDSMSWLLAAWVQRLVSPLLLALAMRTGHDPAPAESEPLLAPDAGERIDLGPLGRDDTAALVGAYLNLRYVDPEVIDVIHGKTRGVPLFSEELASDLCAKGRMRIDNQRGSIVKAAAKDTPSELPATVANVIGSRIDRLAPRQNLTLKIASVLGSEFAPELLRSLLPANGGNADIAGQLAELTDLEATASDGGEGPARYSFKHDMTREVAYQRLVVADRVRLHGEAAAWYERENAADLAPVCALLAHHWDKARKPDKALEYLHKAGEQAVNRYANREAAGFLKRALELIEASADPAAAAQRASCERLLGYALLWMGEMDGSRTHLQASLDLLGFRIPPSRAGQALGSVGQLAVRALRMLPGARSTGAALGPAERDAAMALLRLGHIGYFLEDPFLMLFTALRCGQFAERAEECRESALMFAALAAGAGSIPLHRFATTYGERALRIAESVGDPYVTSQAMLFSAMYRTGIGDWDAGLERIKRAQELSRLSGDNRRREECMVVEGYLHFHRGLYGPAQACFATAADSGRMRRDRQTTAWGLLGVARAHLYEGRWDEAGEPLQQAAPLVADRLSVVELHGQLALMHLQRGERELSLAAARQGAALLAQCRPTSFSTLTGLTAMAESLHGLWSLALAGELAIDPALLQQDCRTAVRALRRFARIFPIGLPQALLQRGNYHRILGHRRRALRLCRNALAGARRLHMPYEEAQATLSLRLATGSRSDALGPGEPNGFESADKRR